MTLPRRMTLRGRDEIGVEPAGAVVSLRGEHLHLEVLELAANEEIVLDSVRGDAIELCIDIEPSPAPMVELNVFRSVDGKEVTRIQFFRDRLQRFPAHYHRRRRLYRLRVCRHHERARHPRHPVLPRF